MVGSAESPQQCLRGRKRIFHAKVIRDPLPHLFGGTKASRFHLFPECFQLSIAQSTLPSFIDEPTQAVQAGLAIGLEPASHRPRNNSQESLLCKIRSFQTSGGIF